MPISPSVTPNRSLRRLLVPADDHDGPRPHVLLFADDLRGTLAAVVGERLGGVFQQPRLAARLARRHRGRQVDQPLRVGGEPAHHLQGRRGVGLPDRDVAPQPGRDDPLAQHVVGVEHVVVSLLRRERRGLLFVGQEGPGRLAVGPRGRDRDELLLRVAQGGELAAEDAAGVDVDRAVEPLRLGDRRVAVDDHRRAPVFRRPVVAHRQAELVGLAGRLAVQGEVPHLARAPPLHLRLHPGVGDDQLAVVEDVVAHQAVEELGQFLAERRPNVVGQGVDLGQRFGQPVRDLHVLAPELPAAASCRGCRARTGPSRPRPCCGRAARVSRMRGPRSTRSPTKTALRPSGWA